MTANCYGAGNCSECISQYRDLEEYILNSTDLLDKVKETFFKTGRHVSKFVYITHIVKIGISSSQSNNTDLDDVDAGINCIDHQTVYIWSESPLYLLGPKPLFWFTLFAINVHETSVTIELPCIYGDVYYDLLSRLMYLVSESSP